MGIGSREIIEFYNEQLPDGIYHRSIWRDADHLLAMKFIAWCNEHEVGDPKLWIWMRFKFMKSGYPGFASLGSEALIPTYKRLLAKRSRERVVKDRGKGAAVRALIDCTPAQEAVRERYVGKEAMCVAQPSLSGGFHPHSMICPACPSATACATKLNAKHGFDVVALRLGKVDGLPEHVRKVVV